MFQSFETHILSTSSSPVSSQVAFTATKARKDKQVFTSEKKGFQGFTPISVTQTSNIISSNKRMSSNSTSGQQKRGALRTGEELIAAFKVFKSICQLCNKSGHSAYKCFKRFNADFQACSS